MSRRLIHSTSQEVRTAAAEDWLGRRSPGEQLLLVADNAGAASELLRRVALIRGAVFGWHRMTLGRMAGALAAPVLAHERRSVVGGLAVRALAARVVHDLGLAGLGRYAPVAERPGFATALARTLLELRLAGVEADSVAAVDPDLARLLRGYERELRAGGLADRASVLRLARGVCSARSVSTPGEAPPLAREAIAFAGGELVGLPLLLLDLAVESAAERELLAELVSCAPDVLATIPTGDEWSSSQLQRVLAIGAESFDGRDSDLARDAMGRLQAYLFQGATPPSVQEAEDDSVTIFSAPGESRECVEVARRVMQEAQAGVPFDRMAILVHSVSDHRRHLEEALARAGIPAHFAGGAVAPDPSGRAFVALLSCAAEDLSARRFAEYLSIGEVPAAEDDGGPPPALPSSERWVPPDTELIPEFLAEIALSAELAARERRALEEAASPQRIDPDADPVRAGTLRTPRRWERMLNDAAVIGGHDRWVRRLDGVAQELSHRLAGLEEPGEPAADGIRAQLAELEGLRAFALPLLAMLSDLPRDASWGEWIDRLRDLATRALRRPVRVLSVLAELEPMAPIGPVGLQEVRLVLTRRLTEMVVPATQRRYGAVFVASPEAVRGLPPFEVVFVPGLAEKLFPRRILEDPVLGDEQRRRLGGELITNEQRVERERLALRLAVGAARRKIYLSYSRLDLQHARPRVPSFYTLEAVRAVQGRLPGFGELARMAEVTGSARLSWPAPDRPRRAIDDGEHDLALLERLLHQQPEEGAGALAHLLTTSPHLGRAVRFRAQRWSRKWTSADGLVRPSPAAREALEQHMLGARSYSATALQTYAVCPYRFLLGAIHRLHRREVPSAIDEMDPLQRGALVHEIQFLLLSELHRGGGTPVTAANLEQANTQLDRIIGEVTARYRDRFAPAIERVWEDGVASVRADLREWLRREAAGASGWAPWRFEYSFGIPAARQEPDLQDPHSTDEPVQLECGIQLRGKIDLVERNVAGHLRVTDHKTGRVRVPQGAVIHGGQALQPLLYALAARQLFDAEVECGRLYYCTLAGEYAERTVPLDRETQRAAEAVAEAVRLALERGFLPAAPIEEACRWCDYLSVCGRDEERRVKGKGRRALKELIALRELP